MKNSNRILVIDDNEHVRDIVKSIVKKADKKSEKMDSIKKSLFDKEEEKQDVPIEFRIDEASQGTEAIEMAKQAFNEGDPYFLVISDVRMPPGIDGIETITGIRKIDPDIAIIIISAYNDYSDEQLVSKFGAERLLFLVKPFHAKDIVKFILSIKEN